MTGQGVDPTLLETWITGWTLARATPPPIAERGGFRVDVGWPQQRRRYVFPDLNEGLIELGETITAPWILLKACASPEALRLVLPPRWEIQPPGWLMAFDGAPAPAPKLDRAYRLQLFEEAGVTVARVIALPDRAEAAIGRVVRVEDAAIYDRIVVSPALRRRGLGSAVMAALGAEARASGARRGLLVATAEGKALYEALGWRVLSPYATAVIPGPSE